MIDINILSGLNIDFTPDIIKKLNIWQEKFIQYNSHTNLMSKNDIEVLIEKHVFDSLAINLWNEFQNFNKILDVGCGGGFPSVILAICFPNKTIIANDSRIKKINFIKEIKDVLELDNLEILYSRIEEAEVQNVDLVVSRAVGKIKLIYELSRAHLKKNGKFLIYKANYKDEIKEFKKSYKKAKFQIIPYKLPLKENYERNLVIVE